MSSNPVHTRTRWWYRCVMHSISAVLLCAGTVGLSEFMPAAVAQTTSEAETAVADNQLMQLRQEGLRQFQTSNFQAALQTFDQLLELRQADGDSAGEAEVRYYIAVIHRILGNYDTALNSVQQALAIVEATEPSPLLAKILSEIGVIHYSRSEFDTAIAFYEQALEISRAAQDRSTEAQVLDHLGVLNRRRGQVRDALDLHQQALDIIRQVGERPVETRILNNIAVVYQNLSEYETALEFDLQALESSRQLGNRFLEARVLNSIGTIYDAQGSYEQALRFYQQALELQQHIGERAGQGQTLNNIAAVYVSQGNYAQALETHQQALRLRRDLGDRLGESTTLTNIGLVYWRQGNYEPALELYQQALAISRAIGDQHGEAYILSSMATVNYNQGDYGQALELYRNAIALQTEIGDQAAQGYSLDALGSLHYVLGEYKEARANYQEALALRQQIGDQAGLGTTLNNLGLLASVENQYDEALDFYQQALSIRQQIGDQAGIGSTLNNIGLAYSALEQYPESLTHLNDSLSIRQAIGDRAGTGISLTNLALVHEQLAQPNQAIALYQQALGIFQGISDRAGEQSVYSSLGDLFARQNQLELAIAFYKQSVNITETIRYDLRHLPQAQQLSYTETVAPTYRQLTDLLLSQGRILEAQTVLELLKLEELRNFTREAVAPDADHGIALTAIEQNILNDYSSLVQFGQQVEQCQQTQCTELSALNQQHQSLIAQYNQQMNEIVAEIRARRAVDDAFFDPRHLSAKAEEIVSAQPGTMLIYPFVLEDKLWLIWAAPNGVVSTSEVPVTQQELGETVLQFRQLLQDARSASLPDLQDTSQRLYDWLIRPLESELQANQVQHLVFSLDRVTRYIPMAALYDGNRYLVEQYNVSTILSADLTDMQDRLPPNSEAVKILAAGLSEAVSGFNPLPNVPDELDAIVRQDAQDATGIYAGQVFLNQDFTFSALSDNLPGHDVLHIATHGQFVAGLPESSYLVLGTGEPLDITRINTLYSLNDVHLVVLSACETALGGPDSNGIEIAGLGYYFLSNQAKAVLASLWSVDDRSTNLLMQEFYRYLAEGDQGNPVTKGEALRLAQLQMIQQQLANDAVGERGIAIQDLASPTTSRSHSLTDYSHPYYWAPFVLIGNNL